MHCVCMPAYMPSWTLVLHVCACVTRAPTACICAHLKMGEWTKRKLKRQTQQQIVLRLMLRVFGCLGFAAACNLLLKPPW